MARSRYEFIKIELRLFSNFKYLMWDDFTQNFYIKLIALAKQNNNIVKKDWRAIKAWLRTERSPRDIEETFERVVRDMKNIGQNRWEFWFLDWDERYSYSGVEKEKDIDIDKEKEKDNITPLNNYYKEMKEKLNNKLKM